MAAEPAGRDFDELVDEANAAPLPKKLLMWTRMSGPGWLQGAITLGGGSLAGSLYLGVIMGYGLMWLQPLAMLLGVIMLAAISYVTLSTGERPFALIRNHVSPVLAWSWLIATMMANIVWSLPQFALGTAALTQNLAPGLDTDNGRLIAAGSLLLVALFVVWFYNSGSRGIRIFEWVLKGLVGLVVISFFGVVAAMTNAGLLPWSNIFAGLVPDPNAIFEPAQSLRSDIAQTGQFADWWSGKIAGMQKDNIITAFATAVGINMTFLLPYSMLRKGWGKRHRGLGIFDLSIGLIVPFVLATSCVVIAAASQFHAKPDDVLAMVETGKGKEVASYHGHVDARLRAEFGDSFQAMAADQDKTALAAARAALPEPDRRLAAMIAERDNLALAKTLEPLVGQTISQKVFGLGVLGMALSTIIILMVINGFAFCEMIGAGFDRADAPHRRPDSRNRRPRAVLLGPGRSRTGDADVGVLRSDAADRLLHLSAADELATCAGQFDAPWRIASGLECVDDRSDGGCRLWLRLGHAQQEARRLPDRVGRYHHSRHLAGRRRDFVPD